MISRAAACAFAVVAAVLAWRLVAIWRQPPPPPPPSVHLQFTPPPGTIFGAGDDPFDAALSPAGDEVVFVATAGGRAQLWRRPMAAAVATPIPGTEGAVTPAWVPGQRAVSFFRNRALEVVALDTGAVTTVATGLVEPAGAAWLEDGSVLVGHLRGPIDRWLGGKATGATRLGNEVGHRFPARVGPATWVYLAERADGSRVIRLSRNGNHRDLTPADGHAMYVDGWLLYPRGGALLAQPLDVDTPQLTRRAEAVLAVVGVSSTGRTQAVASPRLLIAGRGAGPRHRLRWFDGAGQPQEPLSEPGDYWQVRLSPDDTQAAVTMLEPLLRTLDVYVLRGGSGSPVPVSLGLAAESDPVWSPDGLSLLFRSLRGGQANLYTRRVGVQGAPETLAVQTPATEIPSDWTTAGDLLFSAVSGERADTDIFRRGTDGRPAPVLPDGFNQSDARVSADGRLVAYVSDESGQPDVYVTAWPPRGPAPARTRVSQAGGSRPRWAGRSLYFQRGDGEILRADPLPATDGAYTVPRQVLAIPGLRDFDVAHRGARLLAVVPETSMRPAPVEAVVNWTSTLAGQK
jgi:Tol biopolymer transport system component